MSEASIEQRFEELRRLGKQYAEARAQRDHLREYRKVKKAALMRKFENEGVSSISAQERNAYAAPEYSEFLDALHAAEEQAEKLYWELDLVKMKFEMWRTRRADRRAEMNLR